jgi:hypothetical protein
MRRLLALLTLLVLAATPALASDPSSGEVSKATPKVTWNGAITSFQSWQTYNAGQGQCIPPSCDTFTLEVKDAAPLLTIVVESADSGIFVEVVKPDGSAEQFGGADLKVTAKLKNPATGAYTINVAQNEQTQATHKGTAELVFPAAAPPAVAAPAPAPAAAPTPAAPVTLALKAAKPKGRSLPVTVKASAPVTAVKATLLRGKTVVAKGSLARVDGTGVLKLKLKGKPKRGKYTLKVTAVDGGGKTVAKSISFKI